MNDEKAVAVREKEVLHPFTMTPRTFDEALKFAELMSKSDLVPKDFKDKPGNILVAIQKGFEVGLSPMAALETIAVINGRASLWGDGLLGIVQGSAVYESIDESQSSEKAGICTVKRKGEPPYTVTFTLEDAKRAGLLGKAGPWTQYTKRMLQLRARGFALRDKFADVLKGLIAAEEAFDTVAAEIARTEEPPSLTLKEKLKAQIEEKAVAPHEPIVEQESLYQKGDVNLFEWALAQLQSLKPNQKAQAIGIMNTHKDNPKISHDQRTALVDYFNEHWGAKE